MYNFCRRCGHDCYSTGSGKIADPTRKWWQFWKTITCPECGDTQLKVQINEQLLRELDKQLYLIGKLNAQIRWKLNRRRWQLEKQLIQ